MAGRFKRTAIVSRLRWHLHELESIARTLNRMGTAHDQALLLGSSVGSARPKVLLREGKRRLIAKFSSTTDTFAVVKAEFVGMEPFSRLTFNVLSGNTDDHARNHAACWDGAELTLTPRLRHHASPPLWRGGVTGNGDRPRRLPAEPGRCLHSPRLHLSID